MIRVRKLRSAHRAGFVTAAFAALFVATAAPAMAASVTLTVSNTQWLDALRGQRLWAAVKAYETAAPSVTMKQEAIPSGQYGARLVTEMGAGAGPDIAIMQEGLFYALAGAKLLTPLDDVTKGATDLNATNKNGVIGSTRYGIAWQRAVYALLYNRALTNKAGVTVPTDVDQLIGDAKSVSKATGAIGFIAGNQMGDFPIWWMGFQNWAYGYGAHWVNASGKLTIDTPEAVAALTAFKKVYDSGIIPVGDSISTERTRFKAGKVAYAIDNSGSALNMASGGALASSAMVAAPLPFKYPGAHQQLFIAVNIHSKHKDADMAFLKWLISPAGQKALREASGPDTLATDIPATPDFVKKNPWAPEFAELAKHSRSTLIPGYEVHTTEIMHIVLDAVESALVGGVSPEAALKAAQAKVDAQHY